MEQKQEVKNHGLLLGNRPEDWIAGTIPYKAVNPSGDWTQWLPKGEWQYIQNVDLQACVTFSALNVIEILYYFLTGEQRNFSDRFTATLSGTTRNGNYLWKVGDSIRKDGLVDEDEWPTPQILTWENYYVMPPIGIINKGREFLKKWTINYEVIEPTKESIIHHLKQSPIQVCIPGHAVLTFTNPGQVYQYFDSYEPWLKSWDKDFIFAQRIVLTRKRPKGIQKVIRKKDEADCYVVFLEPPCQPQIHKIVGDKVFTMLGLDWNKVVEAPNLDGYAKGGEITEDRIDVFREFFNLSCAEWRAKFAPQFTDKVIGIIGLLWEKIMDFFGQRFGYHIEWLGRHRLGWNCVLYARSRYPSLPSGLWNIRQKRAIINSQIPAVGCVVIADTGWIGHCGIVTSFTQDFSWIEIEEANYRRGYITKRSGSPQSLKILGYYV